MLFNDLNIIAPIQKALVTQGYTAATPIQAEAIAPLLAGSDLLGCAQTGTGKTAAFAIPILQLLSTRKDQVKNKRQIKALILAPTRELAIQIADCFVAYGVHLNHRTLVIFGGVRQAPQTKELQKGIDILVATPGRLLDLINQGAIDLQHVKHFVLDEVDHMLDMGMLHDVKKIISYLPSKRQNMFFSATMPTEIAKLADAILKNPVRIKITPKYSPIDIINQEAYFVDKENKLALLAHTLKKEKFDTVLVFSRTKHGADKIVKELNKNGFETAAIHGNKSQGNRQRVLSAFKDRKIRILVATDIAARGLDIEGLSHVINYNLPEVPETYIHRIGRTGRAGLGGKAITFCDFTEKPLLNNVQKLIGKTLTEVTGHPYPLVNTIIEPKAKPAPRTASARPIRSPRSADARATKFTTSVGGKAGKNSAAPRKNTRNRVYGPKK